MTYFTHIRTPSYIKKVFFRDPDMKLYVCLYVCMYRDDINTVGQRKLSITTPPPLLKKLNKPPVILAAMLAMLA